MDQGRKKFEANETAGRRKSFEKYFVFSKLNEDESTAIQEVSASNAKSSISPLGRQGSPSKGWTLRRNPELIPVHLNEEVYQQHIAQIARILYKQFCQLDLRSNPAKSIGPGLPKKEIRS